MNPPTPENLNVSPEAAEHSSEEITEVPSAEELKLDDLVPSEAEVLKGEADKFRDLYLRGQAEMDNLRKRVSREREEAIRYANLSLLEQLLPVIDNFQLGLEAARNASDMQGILQGLGMVQKQFEDFLRNQNVEVIDASGSVFDHNLHDAVGQEASEEVPEGHVLRQLRKGYKVKDRLVRAASVIVSKGCPEAPVEDTSAAV